MYRTDRDSPQHNLLSDGFYAKETSAVRINIVLIPKKSEKNTMRRSNQTREMLPKICKATSET